MLQSATNYGRGPIVPDLTPDSDSILVMAYFQICDLNAASTEVYLNYLLEALSDHTGALGHSYSQTTSMRVLLDPMSPIEEVPFCDRILNFIFHCKRIYSFMPALSRMV